jgi:hypothetical protein
VGGDVVVRLTLVEAVVLRHVLGGVLAERSDVGAGLTPAERAAIQNVDARVLDAEVEATT